MFKNDLYDSTVEMIERGQSAASCLCLSPKKLSCTVKYPFLHFGDKMRNDGYQERNTVQVKSQSKSNPNNKLLINTHA